LAVDGAARINEHGLRQ